MKENSADTTAIVERAASASDRSVGEILLRHGHVTASQLEEAIELQQQSGKPLGQILVEWGAITRLALASALTEQWSGSGSFLRPPTEATPRRNLPPGWDLAPPPEPTLEEIAERTANALGPLAARLEAVEAALEQLPADDAYLVQLQEAIVDLARRVAATEPVLGEIQTRLAETGSTDSPSELLEELEARIEASFERLTEGEAATAAVGSQLEALATGLHEATVHLAEVAELKATVAELATQPSGDPALAEAVESIASRVGALAERSAVETLHDTVEELRARFAGEFGPRLDELATRVDSIASSTEAALAEVHAGLSEVASRPGVDPELSSRVGELQLVVAELGARPAGDPGLAARIDELGGAVARLEAAEASTEIAGLRAMVEELSTRPLADPGLAARIDELGGAVARLEAAEASTEIADLRAALEELSARPLADPGLPHAVAELAARVEEMRDTALLDDIRARLDELAARPTAEPGLRERLDELASRVEALAAEASAQADPQALEALRLALDELAGRPVDSALATAVAELSARIDLLADSAAVEELRRRVEALDLSPDPDLVARVEKLGLDIARLESDGLDEAVAELRREIAALASREPAAAGLVDRFAELAARLDELEAAQAVEGEARGAAAVSLDAELRSELEAKMAQMAGVAERLELAADGAHSSRAELEARLLDLEARLERVLDRPPAGEIPGAASVPGIPGGPLPEGVEQDLDRLRMAIERVGMKLGEHERALGELMRSTESNAKVQELAGRIADLEARGVGSSTGAGASESVSSDLRTLVRKVEESEEERRTEREKFLTQLERMASSLDWRLQRLESNGSGA